MLAEWLPWRLIYIGLGCLLVVGVLCTLVGPEPERVVAAPRTFLAAVVEHRSGTVTLGEASVAVAVSTAHREDAFSAGRFIIDELKAGVPIWKKEHWPGGSEWSPGS